MITSSSSENIFLRDELLSWENEGGQVFEKVTLDEQIEKLDYSSDNTLWGEQTEKALKYFNIGDELFDKNFIRALLVIKKSMAISNERFGLMNRDYSNAIVKAVDLILESNDYTHFPVKIWQTGSGTQINMNINEVLSNYVTKIDKGFNYLLKIHPNDHVNMSQSSNDVIPSALNISATYAVDQNLLPILSELQNELQYKENKYNHILKVGRTHLMDAVPMSLGQEFSAYKSQIKKDRERLRDTLERTKELPLGGTAIGTGINCPAEVSEYAIELISNEYDIEFKQKDNLFSGISSSDEIVELSGQLKTLATTLLKISTDLIILSSGPDTGIREILLPQNEPGSSIMPGKVNPTQCEALSMVCCQVIGNDMAITLGGMQGKLQLNTFRPLIIRNIFHTLNILCDSIRSFNNYCLKGLLPNINIIEKNSQNSKMIITILTPTIGYDNATRIVQNAEKYQRTIKQEVLRSGLMSGDEINKMFKISSLISPPVIHKQ